MENHDAPAGGESLATSIGGSNPMSVHRAFFGRSGLRAGWRLLIYALGYYILRYLLLFVAGQFLPSQENAIPRLRVAIPLMFFLVAAAVVPAWILSSVEQRPFGTYGLPASRRWLRDFAAGSAWGFSAITLLLLAMRIAGVFSFGSLALHGVAMLRSGALWAVLFLLVGFHEEFLFRGYSQFTLTQGIGFWPAAFLLSALFGAVHHSNVGEAWTGELCAGLIGLFFCFTLRRTGALWFAVAMHAAWDWGETFFYSVPDSGLVAPGHLLRSSFHGPSWLTGGSVGPEGSVLVFVLMAILWIAFDRVYPRARHTATGSTTVPQPSAPVSPIES